MLMHISTMNPNYKFIGKIAIMNWRSKEDYGQGSPCNNCCNGIVNKCFRSTGRRGEDVLYCELNEIIQGQ